MLKTDLSNYSNKSLLLILLGLFFLTEIIDDLLDHVLGNSIFHSLFQLLLFIVLLFVVLRVISLFFKKKISYLIPNNLKVILEVIKSSEIKGVLINQTSLMNHLKITKPTMKKRLQNLKDLDYISIKIEGNHKYMIITDKGNSIIK